MINKVSDDSSIWPVLRHAWVRSDIEQMNYQTNRMLISILMLVASFSAFDLEGFSPDFDRFGLYSLMVNILILTPVFYAWGSYLYADQRITEYMLRDVANLSLSEINQGSSARSLISIFNGLLDLYCWIIIVSSSYLMYKSTVSRGIYINTWAAMLQVIAKNIISRYDYFTTQGFNQQQQGHLLSRLNEVFPSSETITLGRIRFRFSYRFNRIDTDGNQVSYFQIDLKCNETNNQLKKHYLAKDRIKIIFDSIVRLLSKLGVSIVHVQSGSIHCYLIDNINTNKNEILQQLNTSITEEFSKLPPRPKPKKPAEYVCADIKPLSLESSNNTSETSNQANNQANDQIINTLAHRKSAKRDSTSSTINLLSAANSSQKSQNSPQALSSQSSSSEMSAKKPTPSYIKWRKDVVYDAKNPVNSTVYPMIMPGTNNLQYFVKFSLLKSHFYTEEQYKHFSNLCQHPRYDPKNKGFVKLSLARAKVDHTGTVFNASFKVRSLGQHGNIRLFAKADEKIEVDGKDRILVDVCSVKFKAHQR